MNNKECEVKFLINKLPNLPADTNVYYIEQYYFNPDNYQDIIKELFNLSSLDNINTYRVRKIKNNKVISYILTLKSKGLYERDEYETTINEELFKKFINNKISLIIKNRYIVFKDNFKFEFDEYLNLKEILYTVEVEDDDIENKIPLIEEILKNQFKIECKNVSNDLRYRNSNLLKYFG